MEILKMQEHVIDHSEQLRRLVESVDNQSALTRNVLLDQKHLGVRIDVVSDGFRHHQTEYKKDIRNIITQLAVMQKTLGWIVGISGTVMTILFTWALNHLVK